MVNVVLVVTVEIRYLYIFLYVSIYFLYIYIIVLYFLYPFLLTMRPSAGEICREALKYKKKSAENFFIKQKIFLLKRRAPVALPGGGFYIIFPAGKKAVRMANGKAAHRLCHNPCAGRSPDGG